jgi:5-methyltetrahydrofolate--homocysteine methyltransferase
LPKHVDGVDVFPEGPEEMAARVKALIEAGASIVGGCCGTTPIHIQAIRTAVSRLRRRPAVLPSPPLSWPDP